MLSLSPNQTALGVVAIFVAIYLVLVVQRCRNCDGGWRMVLLYSITRLYMGLGFRVRTNGRSPLPDEGGALIVANHRSPVDPVFMMQNSHLKRTSSKKLRVVSFMMVGYYYDIHPLIRFICETMRSIPVDRSGKDMGPVRQALRILKDGEMVGIFPEAGINPGKRSLLPADTGVAWLALTANVPVIPLFIHNAPTGDNMLAPFFNFQRVRLSYGDPISLEEYHGKKKTFDLLSEVTLKIMHELGRLGGVDMTGYRCLEPGEERHTE